MTRGQAVPSRTIRTHDARIAGTCPVCKLSFILRRPNIAHIDSCGFESHSFRCERCAGFLAGIVDPIDGEFLMSLIANPSGLYANIWPHRSTRSTVSSDFRYETKAQVCHVLMERVTGRA